MNGNHTIQVYHLQLRSVRHLPLDEQFERAKLVNFLGNAFKGEVALLTAPGKVKALHAVENALDLKFGESLKNLHDFEVIAVTLAKQNLIATYVDKPLPKDSELEIPTYAGHRWITDAEFGQQILNGVNPVVIRKCTRLPENFPVTNEMVQPMIHHTLDEEMKVSMHNYYDNYYYSVLVHMYLSAMPT